MPPRTLLLLSTQPQPACCVPPAFLSPTSTHSPGSSRSRPSGALTPVSSCVFLPAPRPRLQPRLPLPQAGGRRRGEGRLPTTSPPPDCPGRSAPSNPKCFPAHRGPSSSLSLQHRLPSPRLRVSGPSHSGPGQLCNLIPAASFTQAPLRPRRSQIRPTAHFTWVIC